MQTLYTISALFLLLGILLFIAYLKSGRKAVWHRRLSTAATAISGLLLLAFLGFLPRMAAIRGCTAYVFESGEVHVEDTCKH